MEYCSICVGGEVLENNVGGIKSASMRF
jgi:hypothetical protein